MQLYGFMKIITILFGIIKTAKVFKTVIPVVCKTCINGFLVSFFNECIK